MKKHLIELMIEAGVKWPDGAKYAAQDIDRYLAFYKSKPWHENDAMTWISDNSFISGSVKKLPSLCLNWNQTIVTREQYAEAVAATTQQEAQPGNEWELVEWGDWSIGDEVRFDGFTDTTHDHWSFKVGSIYVIGARMAPISGNGQQPSCNWGFSFSRRKIEPEAAPSIEQLVAEYNRLRAVSVEASNAASEAAVAAAKALVQIKEAGKALGLSVGLLPAKQLEPALNITDWRDLQIGDVIKCVSQGHRSIERLNWIVGEECEVIKTEEPGTAGQPIKVRFKNGEEWWIGGFKFIRRPSKK